jgi:hypothetical protein
MSISSPISALTRWIGAPLGLGSRTTAKKENKIPLKVESLKKILTEVILEQALTAEAYEVDKDNWQPMSFPEWRRMYMKGYCKFSMDARKISVTLLMRHWEIIARQSIMFDPDNFLNALNVIVNEYGWYVDHFSMPNENVTVVFRRFQGDFIVRHPPKHLYYFSAAWNKADILKSGIISSAVFDQSSGQRIADYDILFKTFNLEYIQGIARQMYDEAVNNSDSNDVSTNILRMIGFMPIIIFRVDTHKIEHHSWSRKSPIYDEDKESGIYVSYTFIPIEALDSIVHEDAIPNIKSIQRYNI